MVRINLNPGVDASGDLCITSSSIITPRHLLGVGTPRASGPRKSAGAAAASRSPLQRAQPARSNKAGSEKPLETPEAPASPPAAPAVPLASAAAAATEAAGDKLGVIEALLDSAPPAGPKVVRKKQKAYSKTMKPSRQEEADERLLALCAKGATSDVLALLDGGQEIDVADERGETCVHKAVRCGASELVAELIRRGALADYEDVDGVRPIAIALQMQDEATVRALIDCGADLARINPADGSTLLHAT